ncbi:MAG: hypothetical protein ACLGH3_05180 [Actinomycetota bacterium]
MRPALVMSTILSVLAPGLGSAGAQEAAGLGSAGAQEVGCSWPAKFEADSTNFAFPDDNANSWIARFAVTPETEITIDGRYPHARYFSFHVYDATQAPVDGLADLDLAPDVEGENPFAVEGASHGTYSARIVYGDPPQERSPNTIYAGRGDGTPNPSEMLIYRV